MLRFRLDVDPNLCRVCHWLDELSRRVPYCRRRHRRSGTCSRSKVSACWLGKDAGRSDGERRRERHVLGEAGIGAVPVSVPAWIEGLWDSLRCSWWTGLLFSAELVHNSDYNSYTTIRGRLYEDEDTTIRGFMLPDMGLARFVARERVWGSSQFPADIAVYQFWKWMSLIFSLKCLRDIGFSKCCFFKIKGVFTLKSMAAHVVLFGCELTYNYNYDANEIPSRRFTKDFWKVFQK